MSKKQKINFASDNAAPVCPELMAAMLSENESLAFGYGNDDTTSQMERQLQEVFGCDLRAFPVATGTAANVLGLSVMTPPYGAIYCHKLAHIESDECGSPEFYTHGAKLVLLDGENGKIQPDLLEDALVRASIGVVHHVQPAVVSLTQATECGTIYTPDEVAAISAVAKKYNLGVHMDGARFANAIAELGCSPADVTCNAGVDVLSFGVTKNGGMSVEAVVIFDAEKAKEFEFRRKRGAHLFSKMKFLSAQISRYVQDDLWLDMAKNANEMAQRMKSGLESVEGCTPLHPVQANIIFFHLREAKIKELEDAGFLFYVEGLRSEGRVRLVTSWNTTDEDVDQFLQVLAK
ncbi:MAG: low specificity L-threonine aldolase [Sneathiella sp.]